MRILRILFSIILIFVVAIAGLIFFLPSEQIARLAADQVQAQTGRDLSITGDISINVFPNLGVSTGPISLSNATWSEDGPMFQAESAKIGIDALALLGGTTRVTNITLNAPDILLQTDGQGNANWDDFTADASSGDATDDDSESSVTFEKLTVSKARIRYLEGKDTIVEIPELSADFDWGEGPASLGAVLTLGGAPIATDIRVADLNALIAGDVTQVNFKADVAKNKVDFDGLASIYPEVSGALEVVMPDPSALFAALGQTDPGLPVSDFRGALTLTKERVFSLREGRINAAGNALSAEADVDLTGKPNVVANITTGALDLTPFMSSESTNDTASGWPTDAIDASALGLFDGKITLSATSIDLGTLQFGSSRVAVDVDNARAVATLHQLNGYEGAITGQFVANNRSGFSVGGDIELDSLAMKPLLNDLIGTDRFTGAANATLSFLGAGNSLDAIMNSLRGDGSLNVGSGTISGIDLDQLFRGTPSGGTTIFDSMTASWTIDGGILSNEDLRMELPSVLATGAGTIGLGAQDLDYTFTPQIRNEAEAGFAFPVLVSGPWSDPSIRPDFEAVAKQNFQEEIDALEDKATDAVADRLGVSTEEGQSVGEALEQKIEEEVGNRLRGLLGGN